MSRSKKTRSDSKSMWSKNEGCGFGTDNRVPAAWDPPTTTRKDADEVFAGRKFKQGQTVTSTITILLTLPVPRRITTTIITRAMTVTMATGDQVMQGPP